VIFIDTGAFVARHLGRDQHHAAALAGWQQLARRGWRCLTTSFVLDEAVTLLARRAGARFAADRARAILSSERLTIVRPTADDELVALELLEKFEDKDLSYTDCVSFVTMRARGIRRAFTFDRHFRDAGFALWPAGGSRR
jgi:predicted nucleic acid-binding protein